MSKTFHRIFLSVLVAIVFVTVVMLIYSGASYYSTGLEDRVYHPDHKLLKPSGIIGHGLGIFGSLSMILGVSLYMARKRYRFLSRMGLLKHWLEFHIFLCTLGPFMVLFHTAYKFGGVVAISFWSMVAVFLSGIIGRFIYLQIPRSIEGRELSLNEIRDLKSDIVSVAKDTYNLDDETCGILADSVKRKTEIYYSNALVRLYKGYLNDLKVRQSVRGLLKKKNFSSSEGKKILDLVSNDIRINRRIEQLETMQNFFKYWHVIHLPFALVMLIIMIVHVGVTILFGYRWIF
ncbi:MAG: hypothetical protein IPN68_13215 [Bacteroidetes bacterium]|nr:hypothetical protein [Bacteroidota bacterium]